MKKYKLMTLALPIMMLSTTALASEIQPIEGEVSGSEAKSTSSITLGENTTPWNPEEKPPTIVDPNNPNENGKPEENEGGTGNGTQAFHIDWVSNFNFGTKALTGAAQTVTPNKVSFTPTGGSKEEVTPFAQVTDNSGYGGWTLTVKGSGFKNTTTGATDSGLSLYLNGNKTTQTIDSPNKPIVSGVTVGTDATKVAQVKMQGDDIAMGTYTIQFDDAKLTIPAKVAKGSYENTLTWVMTKDMN